MHAVLILEQFSEYLLHGHVILFQLFLRYNVHPLMK